MKNTSVVDVVKVFVDERNQFGSPLGIVVDEKQNISKKQRQKIATDLNFSETVFIDNIKLGVINVYSPIRECPFSMYAAMGTAWYVNNKLNHKINQLVSRDQVINTYLKNEKTWVRSKISILPPWNFVEYKTIKVIESFKVSDFQNNKHTMVWAWMDKTKGLIRGRTFAFDWGIPEDEANGSGAMKLSSVLGRKITVIHGKGSLICARPIDDSHVEAGGRCGLLKG